MPETVLLSSSSQSSPNSTRTSRRTTNNNTASPDKQPDTRGPSSPPAVAAAGLAGSTSTIQTQYMDHMLIKNNPAYLLRRRRALHILSLRRGLRVVPLVWLLVAHLRLMLIAWRTGVVDLKSSVARG